MIRRITVITAFLLLLAGAAFAQQSSGGDTKRRTIAITYPSKGKIDVKLTGTTRTPKANAGAQVQRVRGLTQVEIELDDMVPAYLLGADYTTYVLWAITPEGQVENMGEFRLNGSRSKLRATTRFDTFSMIVTAEPHYAVTKPSRLVVLENVPPKGPVALQSAEIFFTGDSGRYFSDDQLPEATTKEWAKQPIELLGARRAVDIARRARAEEFAKTDLSDALDSLSKAETSYLNGDRPTTELLGRKSIREAERARELAEERAEAKAIRDRDREHAEAIAASEHDKQELLDKVADLEAELRVSESGRQRAEEEAERAHDETADLRVQVRNLQAQVDTVTEQARQAEDRLGMIEKERESERQANQRVQSYQSLNQMLAPVATVQSDARGFKVVLPDSLFDPRTGSLRQTAAAKLNPIAGVLLGQPGVEFVIEGYLDDRGQPDAVLQASQLRAQAVGDFLSAAGVASDRFKVTGYGSANPVASNKTLKGRTANRRVELVFLKP
jgi:outer membrane protein OmpA-like peptidoglycan-associated protein